MVAAAIESARTAHAKATGRWTGRDEDERDAATESEQHANAALEHLDAGRWDDAQARAELCVELDEAHGSGDVWREFALLVEEAAELGRA
jgi:hypothetical protein